MREAFAYAFDREAWCREIEFGDCMPTLSWIPPGFPGYIETDAYAFDPEKARQALAESSYGGPENLPEIVWYYWCPGAASPEELRDAEWLAAQYREVLGVELKLVPNTDEEWDACHEDPATTPQLEWRVLGPAIPGPAQLAGRSTGRATRSSTPPSSATATRPSTSWSHRADAELDPAKRLALYEEAQRLLLADAPTIILDNTGLSMLIKPYVVGYVVTPADIGFPGWFTPLTIDIAPAA